ISARGTASSIKAAEANCAWSILARLYSLGLVPPKGMEPIKISKKNIPEVVARVDDELVKRIDRYLDSRGIKPVDPDPFINGGSLVLHSKLNEFKTAERTESRKPEWAPAMENWNAWRARPIDMPPWNTKTLEEISQRLLELEREKRANAVMKASRESLPIFKHRQQIIDAIESNTVVMIKGATGSGKSTQVCQYLLETYLESGRGAEFNCYVTQPRRISAVSLAERVAAERSESLERMGQRRPSIGYSIRFQSSPVRPYGGVMFCTVGILLRKMESGLKGISHLIIDEIHERDIDTDFLLIVVRDLIRAYPNLRLVLMSATIDTKLFTDYFGTCPIIEVDGRTFPVQTFYLENLIPLLGIDADAIKSGGMRFDEKDDESFAADLDEPCDPIVKEVLARLPQHEIPVDIILTLLKNICDPKVDAYEGSILIFLPGWNEISTLMDTLKADEVLGDKDRFLILPLHSCLTPQEQRRVFERFPSGSTKRKIILSTNIAETSVTIEDVVYVIDSCKVRQSSYTAATNLTVYSDAWASKTNLTQRQGRAGRVQSGYCFRLITEAQYRRFDEHGQAEMLRTPLTSLALMIKLLGMGAVSEFLAKAVEPPPGEAVANALRDLKEMGALEESEELTDLGRLLARMPIDPKMGKTLVLGAALG
ncbi:dosage compensation regulator isoform 1, partial [Aphelenchoides avenae]